MVRMNSDRKLNRNPGGGPAAERTRSVRVTHVESSSPSDMRSLRCAASRIVRLLTTRQRPNCTVLSPDHLNRPGYAPAEAGGCRASTVSIWNKGRPAAFSAIGDPHGVLFVHCSSRFIDSASAYCPVACNKIPSASAFAQLRGEHHCEEP